MKLEEQVVSLELSKKLKEAGYHQEGYFRHWYVPEDYSSYTSHYHYIEHHFSPVFSGIKIKREKKDRLHKECLEKYSCIAPTVAELGEGLPVDFHSFKLENGSWRCFYNDISSLVIIYYEAETEADARAKMWLELKQRRLV